MDTQEAPPTDNGEKFHGGSVCWLVFALLVLLPAYVLIARLVAWMLP